MSVAKSRAPIDEARGAPPWSPAARRILRSAAELFTQKGYSATTTRDIAAAVGVRQPAIYKHFTTKDAILAALVRLGLEYPLELAAHVETVPAPAVVKLHCWLMRSLRHFDESPFVLASILLTPEVYQEQFEAERTLVRRFEDVVFDFVRSGQREGDVRDIDPLSGARLVLALCDALAVPAIAVDPQEIVDFALIGLLAKPTRLTQIRRKAEALDESLGVDSPEPDRSLFANAGLLQRNTASSEQGE
jgi:AcrR family transcriptional regulator